MAGNANADEHRLTTVWAAFTRAVASALMLCVANDTFTDHPALASVPHPLPPSTAWVWGLSCAVVALLCNKATGAFDCTIAGLLQFRTLWCKLIAVTFSMGGGLIAGKDGPLIHTGGIVGGGLGKLSPRCISATCHIVPRRQELIPNKLLACP